MLKGEEGPIGKVERRQRRGREKGNFGLAIEAQPKGQSRRRRRPITEGVYPSYCRWLLTSEKPCIIRTEPHHIKYSTAGFA